MKHRGGILVIALVIGCRVEVGPPERARSTECDDRPQGRVMIYTSMYRSVIDAMTPILAERLPDIQIQWLQGGSEKLATRVDAELAAHAPQADLILTSDPFWYERLRREGHLAPYAALRALAMPRSLVHPEGAYVTSRISSMVIAYNTQRVPLENVPRTFEALFSEDWTGRVTTPDPMGSGTTFTTLAFLTDKLGDKLIDRMTKARTISSGGNSSTLTRIESGEHDVGFVLLENLLAARARGASVDFVVPDEGAVLIPGPIALLKGSPNPVAARAVYDVLLSTELQTQIVKGSMHSPFEDLKAPPRAPPLARLLNSEYRWTQDFIDRTVTRAENLRKKFAARNDTP